MQKKLKKVKKQFESKIFFLKKVEQVKKQKKVKNVEEQKKEKKS